MVAYIYSKASNTFQFEMQGDGVRFGNYIALGLSDDSFMGDDLVSPNLFIVTKKDYRLRFIDIYDLGVLLH